MRHATRLYRLAIGTGDDMRLLTLPHPNLEQLLCLPKAMPTKFFDHD